MRGRRVAGGVWGEVAVVAVGLVGGREDGVAGRCRGEGREGAAGGEGMQRRGKHGVAGFAMGWVVEQLRGLRGRRLRGGGAAEDMGGGEREREVGGERERERREWRGLRGERERERMERTGGGWGVARGWGYGLSGDGGGSSH
ncbi:hypothetical protein KP509_05G102800 [Ceratopteris richardii]|uniref:Uncharacterized protein n=1 Tax=Ceratopteris richardii TaxID=49495 RepID=A0A8T2UX49_CERRI|nr:hypothetical protein KP509_05G102800 [Ceratopteris richardii]